MAKCVVKDWQGKEAGEANLDLKVAKETSALDLMQRAVVRQQAPSRQGTASTLTRSEVRGGGRKPYKQKGTGRARQGSIRTPLRPGGGIIFGPKPRSYGLSMNRKERRLALRTALMSRLEDTVVVKDFGAKLKAPKTSEIVNALSRFGIAQDSKVLIILSSPSDTNLKHFASVLIFLDHGHIWKIRPGISRGNNRNKRNDRNNRNTNRSRNRRKNQKRQ